MLNSSSRKTSTELEKASHSLAQVTDCVERVCTFSFHTYKSGNFRLHWYVLHDPMLTKAFPWPFQRDFTPLVND